jgi:type II secretory pathway pseudopilin PulG
MAISKSLTPRCKTAKAFTLLELLVVSILMTIVFMIIAQFWKWFSPSLNDMIGRWHLLRESKLATQILAQDFGSTVGAMIVGENELALCKDTGNPPNGVADWSTDTRVDYYLSGDKLMRSELDAGANFAIADGVSGFTVESVPPVIRITLDLQSSTASRQLVFYWNMP